MFHGIFFPAWKADIFGFHFGLHSVKQIPSTGAFGFVNSTGRDGCLFRFLVIALPSLSFLSLWSRQGLETGFKFTRHLTAFHDDPYNPFSFLFFSSAPGMVWYFLAAEWLENFTCVITNDFTRGSYDRGSFARNRGCGCKIFLSSSFLFGALAKLLCFFVLLFNLKSLPLYDLKPIDDYHL